MKIQNNTGSEVEPCGTPDSMGKAEQGFHKVRTTKNFGDKELWMKLI
jgi:hypothetical protein